MYFEYVCVPGETILKTFSAANIVNAYANGVRDIVDKNR